MGLKKVAKTATGIFAGTVAKDAFGAASQSNDLVENLGLKAVGSIAASTSFHLLKDDILEVAREIKGLKSLPE